MEIVLSSCENSGFDIIPYRKLPDLGCANDAPSLTEDPSTSETSWIVQMTLKVFGVRSFPPKCIMLLQDWIGPRSNLVLVGKYWMT